MNRINPNDRILSIDKRSEEKRALIRKHFPSDYAFKLEDFFSVTPYTLDQIVLGNKTKEITQWRQILSVFHFMNGKTLSESGGEIHKDHSTVLHSITLVINAFEGFYDTLQSKLFEVIDAQPSNVIATRDASMNEMISIAFIESNLFEKFPNLANENNSFSFGYSG